MSSQTLSIQSSREQLVSALEQENPVCFLDLATRHYSRADPFNFSEAFEGYDKDSCRRLWRGAEKLCEVHFIDKNLLESEDEEEQQEGVAILRAIVAMVMGVFNQEEVLEEILPVVEVLHGVLPVIPERGYLVQNNIAKICEKWWQKDLTGRELLIPHTLPFLLIRTMVQGSTVADVQRLWVYRHALLMIDFEDDSCEQLKSLLLQCLLHPLFLKTEEGRRFLSFLFGLHPSFTEQAHATIKENVPNCPKPLLDSYGDVYFRAWRTASGVYLEKIETDCLQDLMYHAVHAQHAPVNLAAALRQLLSFIHQQKVYRGVDEMLLRLYEPIIWRALKVANVMVRSNAAYLLLDAFPLQNPDATREENDELLQKQFGVLEDLLADPSPLIRTTGVKGVCRVVGIYWELIPSGMVQTLIMRLVKDMCCDGSSSAVRASVLEGLAFVLDNRLSHPYLAQVLPQLRLHVHDTSEHVRIAVIHLLLGVRNVRKIKFWDVVPMDHLLHRLAVDGPAVMRPLVKLLFHSFQPISKNGEVQLHRCVTLVKTNRAAARKFYQLAHLHMSPPQIGKFIIYLTQILLDCIEEGKESAEPSARSPTSSRKRKSKKSAKQAAAEDQEEQKEDDDDDDSVVPPSCNSSDEPLVLSASDEELMVGLLECITIMWQSVHRKLEKPGCKSVREKLIKQFSSILPQFFETFRSSQARAAVLLLASDLPPDSATVLNANCLEMLASLPASATVEEYAPLVGACCAWGHTKEVLCIIQKCLHEALRSDTEPKQDSAAVKSKTSRTRKRGKKAQVEMPEPEVNILGRGQLALSMLTWMLVQPMCRASVLTELQLLQDMVKDLRSVLGMVEQLLGGPVPNMSSEEGGEMLSFLRSAFCMYTRLEVHLHTATCEAQASSDEATTPQQTTRRGDEAAAAGSNESFAAFYDLFDWARDVLVVNLGSADESTRAPLVQHKPRRGKRKADQDELHQPAVCAELQTKNVAICVLSQLLTILADMTIHGLGDHAFLERIALCISDIIDTGEAGPFIAVLCKLVFQLTERFDNPAEELAVDVCSHGDPVPDLVTRLLKWLAAECLIDEDRAKKQFLPVVQPTISEVLRAYHRRHNFESQGRSASVVMAGVAMAIVGMVMEMAEQEYGREACTNYGEFPLCVTMLMNVVSRSSPAMRSFLEQLLNCFDMDAFDSVSSCMAVVHIISASLAMGRGRREHLAEVVAAVSETLSCINEPTSLDDETQLMFSKATEAISHLRDKLSAVS